MPPKCKILGGYILTPEEVATYARELGIKWSPYGPSSHIGSRIELNRWMIDQGPLLWYFRLQPMLFEGGQVVKLIFPTVGIMEGDYTVPDWAADRASEADHHRFLGIDHANHRPFLHCFSYTTYQTVHENSETSVASSLGYNGSIGGAGF